MKFLDRDIKGIIFDLDGTLFDSCGMWHQIDVNFFKKRNMELPIDYAKKIAHLGLVKAATYTKETFNLKESEEELIAEWNDAAIYEYTNNVYLKPGVVKFLDYLKENNVKLGIATANSKEYYMPCLKHNNIENYFQYICDVNEFKGGKDKPDIYLKVSNNFDLNPSEMVVFEDIPTALNTARNVGFMTVAVDDKSEAEFVDEKKELSDLFITDFNDERLYK